MQRRYYFYGKIKIPYLIEWNKYEILGIKPPGYKKSEKNFIGALTPTPHAHIGARIQASL